MLHVSLCRKGPLWVFDVSEPFQVRIAVGEGIASESTTDGLA
jgi:hypothetical protein